MNQPKPSRCRYLIPAIAVGLMPSDAFAYIEIGTASMLLQLLVASLAGALVVVKVSWARLRDATVRLFRGEKQPAADQDLEAADTSQNDPK